MDTVPEDQPFQALKARLAHQNPITPPAEETTARKEPLKKNGYRPTRKISRRAFVFTGLALIGAALAPKIPDVVQELLDPPSPQKPKITQTPVTPDVVKTPEFDPIEPLNNILNLPLSTEIDTRRFQAEVEYVKKVKNITDYKLRLQAIDLGFQAIVDWQLRIDLLDLRQQIRESCPETETKLRRLTKKERDWADKHRIHHEPLAICTDQYFEALKILEDKVVELELKNPGQGKRKFLEMYRQDLLEEEVKVVEGVKVGRISQETVNNIKLRDLLPKPGTMVGIIFHESGSSRPTNRNVIYPFAYIGDKSAPSRLPKGTEESYYRFINKLSTDGKLKYPADKVAAGVTGDLGATQFRPDSLDNHYDFLKDQFNIILNPFGLDAREAYLFLGRGAAWTDNNNGERKVQYGYIIGDVSQEPVIKNGKVITLGDQLRNWAFDKWNPSLAEKNLQWALDYYQDIVEPGFFDSEIVTWYRKNYNLQAA